MQDFGDAGTDPKVVLAAALQGLTAQNLHGYSPPKKEWGGRTLHNADHGPAVSAQWSDVWDRSFPSLVAKALNCR